MKFKEWTPKLGPNAWVAESSSVIGRESMGEESAVWFGCVVRGDVHHITIGDRSNIQDLSMIHVTHHKKADMSDGNPTVIGKESIVGASALVTKNKVFPPRSLIVGSPAKAVRTLTDEEVAELYASAERYVTFKNEYL